MPRESSLSSEERDRLQAGLQRIANLARNRHPEMKIRRFAIEVLGMSAQGFTQIIDGQTSDPGLMRLDTFFALIRTSGTSADELIAETFNEDLQKRSPLLGEAVEGFFAIRQIADHLISGLAEYVVSKRRNNNVCVSEEFIRSVKDAIADEGLSTSDYDAIADRLKMDRNRVRSILQAEEAPTIDEMVNIFERLTLQSANGAEYYMSDILNMHKNGCATTPKERSHEDLHERTRSSEH